MAQLLGQLGVCLAVADRAAAQVRRSALPARLKAPAVAAIAVAAVLLLAAALAAAAYALQPAPSPCLQPDTAGGDPCTTPVELRACANAPRSRTARAYPFKHFHARASNSPYKHTGIACLVALFHNIPQDRCMNRCALTQPRTVRPPDSSGTICYMPDGGYAADLHCEWHVKVTARPRAFATPLQKER